MVLANPLRCLVIVTPTMLNPETARTPKVKKTNIIKFYLISLKKSIGLQLNMHVVPSLQLTKLRPMTSKRDSPSPNMPSKPTIFNGSIWYLRNSFSSYVQQNPSMISEAISMKQPTISRLQPNKISDLSYSGPENTIEAIPTSTSPVTASPNPNSWYFCTLIPKSHRENKNVVTIEPPRIIWNTDPGTMFRATQRRHDTVMSATAGTSITNLLYCTIFPCQSPRRQRNSKPQRSTRFKKMQTTKATDQQANMMVVWLLQYELA